MFFFFLLFGNPFNSTNIHFYCCFPPVGSYDEIELPVKKKSKMAAEVDDVTTVMEGKVMVTPRGNVKVLTEGQTDTEPKPKRPPKSKAARQKQKLIKKQTKSSDKKKLRKSTEFQTASKGISNPTTRLGSKRQLSKTDTQVMDSPTEKKKKKLTGKGATKKLVKQPKAKALK